MQKWEHIVKWMDHPTEESRCAIHQKLLDEMSADGWELVTVIQVESRTLVEGMQIRSYWKRPTKIPMDLEIAFDEFGQPT